MRKRKQITKSGLPSPVAKSALVLSAILFVSAGCSNSLRGTSRTTSGTTTGVTGATGISSSSLTTYKISTVTIATGSSAGTTPTTTVYFDTAKSTGPITESCAISASGSNSKPCTCSFDWDEIDPSLGSATPIKRSVQTAVTGVQPYAVTCLAPSVYNTEIKNGTMIRIKVQAGVGNSSAFTVDAYSYTKSTVITSGSFLDAQGRAFDNVLHYSCYEYFKRGLKIQSYMEQASDPKSGSMKRYPSASKFCLQTFGSAKDTSENCKELAGPDFSAQSNYFSLYIRGSERGDINTWNDRFICPAVKEAIRPTTGGIASEEAVYPLDTTFALSLGRTADFSVGVESYTKLGKTADDPTQQDSSCDSGTAGGGALSGAPPNKRMIRSCLGFAAKPSTDGTCPAFKDQFNKLRPTYRLRRYIATLPQVFDTNGRPIAGVGQPTDTIYVLDRPVLSASAAPDKPYTMRGPKPCPYSYFDHNSVLEQPEFTYDGTSQIFGTTYQVSDTGFTFTDDKNLTRAYPQYASTYYSGWDSKNVDGTELPNHDGTPLNLGGALSCAAAVPVLSDNKTSIGIVTVNRASNTKHVYIRPIQHWAPHYEEDTSFQACAPEPAPGIVDPPLHFAKDPKNGNIAWCAEMYPSQNPHVEALEKKAREHLGTAGNYYGFTANYTSHTVKKSLSAACSPTVASGIPTAPTYPAASALACNGAGGASSAPTGIARHPSNFIVDFHINWNAATPAPDAWACATTTCDRTVIPPSGTSTSAGWKMFPLLARPVEVEKVLLRDSSYQCDITWDNGGSKSSSRLTPAGGCCGTSVQLKSGAVTDATKDNFSAHLEPDVPCMSPQY